MGRRKAYELNDLYRSIETEAGERKQRLRFAIPCPFTEEDIYEHMVPVAVRGVARNIRNYYSEAMFSGTQSMLMEFEHGVMRIEIRNQALPDKGVNADELPPHLQEKLTNYFNEAEKLHLMAYDMERAVALLTDRAQPYSPGNLRFLAPAFVKLVENTEWVGAGVKKMVRGKGVPPRTLSPEDRVTLRRGTNALAASALLGKMVRGDPVHASVEFNRKYLSELAAKDMAEA